MKRLITSFAMTAALVSCSQTPTNADGIRTGYQALNSKNYAEAESKFKDAYAGFKAKNIQLGMFHALIALSELELKRQNLAAAEKYADDAYDAIGEHDLQPDGITFYKLLSKQLLIKKQLLVQSKKELTAEEATLSLYQHRNHQTDVAGFNRLAQEVLTIPADLLREIVHQYPDGSFRRELERQLFIQKIQQATTLQQLETLVLNYSPEQMARLNRVWQATGDKVKPLDCFYKLATKCLELEAFHPLPTTKEIFVLETFGQWSRVFNTKHLLSGWVMTDQLQEVYSSTKRAELNTAVALWENNNRPQLASFAAANPAVLLPIYQFLSLPIKELVKPALQNSLAGKSDFQTLLALYSIEPTSANFSAALGKASTELQYEAILAVSDGKVPSYGATAAKDTLARIYRSQGDERSLRKAFAVSASVSDLELLLSKLQSIAQLENFIVQYKDLYPSVLNDAKFKLAALYVREGNAASYLRAYELTNRAKEGELALSNAKTSEDKQKFEQLVLQKVAAPSVVFDISVNGVNSSIKSKDGSGSFLSFARYRLSTFSLSYGTIDIRPNARSPIKLGAGAYKVKLETTAAAPVQYMRESQWQGSDNSQRLESASKIHEVIVQPPSYSATISPLVAEVETAMVQRGMMGGVSAHIINGPIEIRYRITSIEAVPYQGNSTALQVNFSKLAENVSKQTQSIQVTDTISASQDELQNFLRIDSERAEEMRREQLRQRY